jgi:hypothetical protein
LTWWPQSRLHTISRTRAGAAPAGRARISRDPIGASGGVYIAKASEPAQGWVAHLIELTFPSGGLFPFKFTTGVRVTPEVLPFGPPPEMARRP